MYPVYREMNSHPYQRNHMPSMQYYHPSWEGAPSQMKEDPSNSSCTHESWPHNYCYPVPMQCHNCCTHGQHPGYYNFRPPCSHFPPPPPSPYHHIYGGYPLYPQPYPMYYGPPPQYPMEIPRYEYDKSVPRNQFHCCGCLNHPHHVKGGSNVKIEEHEPDVEKKKSEPSSPVRSNNFPYPIMWIPPEFTMNKEQPRRLVDNEGEQQQVLPYVKKPQVQQRPIETGVQENEGATLGRKPNQNVQSDEQDPNVNYGWFPLDINRIKQLMEGGDVRQTRDEGNINKNENKAPDVGNKDNNKQPYFPLFWMPCDGREKGSLKEQGESTADGKATEEPPYNVLPRKIEHADNEAEKQSSTGVDDSKMGTTGADKKKIVKTIPVKQLDESAPKVSKKEEEHKQDTTKNVTSVQSSSTTKKSKLPPICLRIDPPKKKKSNGRSRSPSPPGDKNRQDSDESNLKRKSEQPHKEISLKDVEKKTHSQNQMELSNGAEVGKKGSETLKDSAINAVKNVVRQANNNKTDDVKSGVHRAEAQEPQVAKGSCQESKEERKVMSELEAAVAIQTAYRGHHIRRSEPIKKLKEIAKVREEAVQVKRHLEDLESRTPVDVKEKTAIGETIMNLLLKLDVMQGLHQSIRDVRKSVAKELISLQEKLDSITSQQSVVLTQNTSTNPAVEESPRDSDLVGESEGIIESAGKPSKDSSLDGDENSKIGEEVNISSCDLSSSQPLPCQDGESGYENDGDVAPASLDLNVNSGLDASGAVLEKSATEFKKPVADTSSVEDMMEPNQLEFGNKTQEASVVSALPQEVGIAVEDDFSIGNKNQEENLLSEQPQEDDELFANVSISEDSVVENDVVAENENHESDIMSELPLDVVEEDEKDDRRTEQPQEVADSVSNMDKEAQEDLLPEINSDDDGKVQIEVENSSKLNKDEEVNQPTEKQGLKSEVMVVVENENQKPFESSSLETVSCQEAESISSSTNMETSKETAEISNVLDQEVVNSSMMNKDKVEQPTEKQGVKSEDMMAVENESQRPLESSSLVTVSGQAAESISSSTNIKTSKETSEISNTVNVSEHESKSDNVEQEHPVETLVPELDMQQFKDEDGALGRSLEGQNSAAALEMDEQVDKKIIEENEKLRAMLENLLVAGKEQQEVISNLNGKVKDLEKKLGNSKKKKSAKHPRVRISRRLCGKPDNDSLRGRTMAIAS